MSDTIEVRVRRGALALDAVDSAWYTRVNLGDLDMNSCSRCVMGQVVGNLRSFPRLFPEWAKDDDDGIYETSHPLVTHGFWAASSYENNGAEYNELRRAWENEIAHRRFIPAFR